MKRNQWGERMLWGTELSFWFFVLMCLALLVMAGVLVWGIARDLI